MVNLKDAERLVSAFEDDLGKDGRLGKVARYLDGNQDLPYCPRSVGAEYRELARKAITNWLPLIVDTYAKGLYVDGYRPARQSTNSAAWQHWQANGLDARQSIVYRGALEHGTAHTLVLPGSPSPRIRALSPMRAHAWYADDDDDFPELGLVRRGELIGGGTRYDLIDASTVTPYVMNSGKLAAAGAPLAHGLGVVPMVRFRDRLDGVSRGIVAPLFNIQDRINEAVFALMIAIQYASFRQRWAIGLELDVDEREFLDEAQTQPNPNYGKAIEPFKAGVDRLWVSDSTETKFGDFAQTETSGHLASYDSAVRTLAAIAQTPPHVLLGDLVNLSADALAAAEASTQRKISEYESVFGESWEQTLRLASAAAGDTEGASDTSAQVRWRDTEARSLASTVDALGKMAQMLAVPAQELWSRIPGVTDQDVERWRETAGKSDGLAAIAEALTRQSATTAPAAGASETAPNQAA